MTDNGATARPVALVTARAARAQDADLPLLQAALAARGVSAAIIDWDDAQVDWSQFALALLRSTWDYSARLEDFFSWLDRAALATRVINPPAIIRWNLDKHYLAELQRAGVPTVPTDYIEPGDDIGKALERFLHGHGAAEMIIKPAVGSGARDAQRHPRCAVPQMLAHLSQLLAQRRSALLQPHLERIDAQGETALIYINGEFSHAVCKSAVLSRGHGPMRELFAPEEIVERTPTAEELALAERTLQVPPVADLLYARIDLVPDPGGRPCVLELELAEPSLYLNYAAQAPARLAAALTERLCARGS